MPYRHKLQILAQSLLLRRKLFARLGIGIIGLLGLSSIVVAIALPAAENNIPTDPITKTESLQLPSLEPEISSNAMQPFIHEGRVQQGDTLQSLLQRLGIQDAKAIQFLSANTQTRSILRNLRPGKTVLASTTDAGELLALELPQSDLTSSIRVERNANQTDTDLALTISIGKPEIETRTLIKSSQINSSLFAATDAIGLPDNIAISLADIFGNEIDFHRDLRKGDRFSVIYEAIYYRGIFLTTGRILAAEFYNKGDRYTAVWYNSNEKNGQYYSFDGKSLKQGFLRSPLEFSRITSGFAMRFHPIRKRWIAHKGVDYGAPAGTRIKATADGTVEFAGWQNGYGNIVIIQHANDYSTAYAHMRKFTRGLHRGEHVTQGEVIGEVGSTGWATGPHLHYEFRIHGVHKDPLKVALPQAAPLNAQEFAIFQKRSQEFVSRLELGDRYNIVLAE